MHALTVLRHPSLRLRLTLWYTALLAVILLLFSAILVLRLTTSLRNNLDETLRTRADLIVSTVRNNGVIALDAAQLPRLQGEQVTRLYDPTGTLLSTDPTGMENPPSTPDDVATALRGKTTIRSISTGENYVRLLTMPLPYPPGGVLQVGLSEDDNRDAVQQLITIILTLTPLTVLVAAIVGLFLARRALVPVDRITQAARRIEAADLHLRLPEPKTDDEIGRLARTLNALIARLEAAFERQRQFTADASHELRTPLTIMQGELDVTLNRPRNAADYRATLVAVREEVGQLRALVADLLVLARSDDGMTSLASQVDIALVATAACVALQPLLEARGHALLLAASPAIVRGTSSDLERLARNLIENAIRYTPQGGRITVSVATLGENAVLRVADTGPGIAPDALPHLFERFYRTDSARARAAGGSGLGLALAQEIARRHGGEISVTSVVGEGSVFTVALPHARAPTSATVSAPRRPPIIEE